MKNKIFLSLIIIVLCVLGTPNVLAATTVNVSTVGELQSAHPYSNSMNTTWVYTAPTNVENLQVTFSNDTATESGYDYIYILDGSGTQIGRYTGTSLAGQTITVPGNVMKIQLTSDSSVTKYGFNVTNIEHYIATLPTGEIVATGIFGGNISWKLNDYGTLTISGKGEMEEYFVDNFEYPEDIKKITIEDGITSIGEYAFDGFLNLTDVQIPDSITKIEKYAFEDCAKLTTISLPETLTSLDDGVFKGCTSLSEVTLPNSITKINDRTFYNCTNLKTVYWNENINSIGDYAFYNCTGITNLLLPDGITYIGERAFYNCNQLTNFLFNENLQSIGDYAFASCSNLETIEIPDNVIQVGNGTFEGCIKLSEVFIGDGLTEIADYVFSGCSVLENITIGNSIQGIGESAFSSCTRLTSIDTKNTVSIGNKAFYNCSLLRTIMFNNLEQLGESAFRNCIALESIAIPDSTESVGNYAFAGCTSLKSINLGDGITTLSDYMLNGCSSLESVTFGKCIESIGQYTFANCVSIETISLNNSLFNIGNYAFNNCSNLSKITVTDNVETIGYGVFQNCTKLAEVSLGKINKISDNTFYNCTSLENIDLSNVTEIGASAFYNCALEEIALPSTLTSIGNSAFNNCKYLAAITIPDSVVEIGNSAFYNCTSLKEIKLGSNVTTINNSTFYGCSSLEHIDLARISQIGSNAFQNCTMLTNVTIPDFVQSIGSNAFYGCTSLESISFGSGVSNISDYLLYNCVNLKTVTLGDNIASIGNYAFYGCSSIESIILPDSVTYIYGRAFYNCSNLVRLDLGKNIQSINYYAFYGCSNLTDVYYNGTEDDWLNISIGSSNAPLTNAQKHYIVEIDVVIEGNGKVENTNTYYPGDTVALIATPYENEEFLGWYIEDELVCEDVEFSFKIQTDIQVYAKFTENTCLVSFVDGANILEEIRIQKETGIALPEPPEKDNYVFIGYYFDEYYETPIDAASTYSEDTVIYAKYTPIQNSNGFLWYEKNEAAVILEYVYDDYEIFVPFEIYGYTVDRIEDNAFFNMNYLENIYIPNTITSIGKNVFSSELENLNVYYLGSKDEWDTIDIGTNTALEEANFVYNISIIADVEYSRYYPEENGLYTEIYASYIKIDCVAYVEIFNLEDELEYTYGPYEFSSYDDYTELFIEINADNNDHIVKISFFEDDTRVVSVGVPVYFDFYAQKETFQYNGFYYQITENQEAEIVGCRYMDYEVYIPEKLNEYTVTSIAENCFRESYIQTILIPKTINNIDDFAFADCYNLENIYYLGAEYEWKDVTIGENNECLSSVNIVYNYSELVQGYLYRLNYDGNAVIGQIRFNYIYKECIAEIAVLDELGNVEKTSYVNIYPDMGAKQFGFIFESDNKEHLIKINFISDKENKTLYGEAEMPYGEAYFYAGKQHLYEQNFAYEICDDGVEIVDYQGEETDVVIPEQILGYNVVGIGSYAFEGVNITSIQFPLTVSYIANYGFADSNISEITIPEHITNIGEFAFEYCHNLSVINVAEENPNYSSLDGNLYNKDKTELIYYAIGKEDSEFVLPDSVTKISSGAFAYAEFIDVITIPASVTEIDDFAFAWSSVSIANIPSSVNVIGNGIFEGCQNLEAITVSEDNTSFTTADGVLFSKEKMTLLQYPAGNENTIYEIPSETTTIASNAFNGTILETIIIPKSVEVIEPKAMEYLEYLNIILYCGSESEWNELLENTWRNEALQYADIIFDYNENMKVNGRLISCYYDNDTVTANVRLNYIMEDCKVILAIYDDDGRMITLTEGVATVDDYTVSISCPADESYIGHNIKVMFWNSLNNLKPVGNVVTGEVKNMIFESQHPYEDHCDETQVYTYNGECESLSISFSYDTQTENGCDYIYIYDMNDDEIGRYCGTELSGRTITIPGNGFKIRLTSDGSVTDYGYKIDKITANKEVENV